MDERILICCKKKRHTLRYEMAEQKQRDDLHATEKLEYMQIQGTKVVR